MLISQSSYLSNSLKTLSKGTPWSSIGVTCDLGSHTIVCFRDNHGFVIGNGKYKSF